MSNGKISREFMNNEIKKILPYIKRWAGYYSRPGSSIWQDLCQDGTECAIKKLSEYNPNVGAFSTWARWHVRRHMSKRRLRYSHQLSVVLRAKDVPLCISMENWEDGTYYAFQILEKGPVLSVSGACYSPKQEMLCDTNKAAKKLMRLTDRESDVFLLSLIGEYSTEEIAGMLGFSRARAWQLRRGSLRKFGLAEQDLSELVHGLTIDNNNRQKEEIESYIRVHPGCTIKELSDAICGGKRHKALRIARKLMNEGKVVSQIVADGNRKKHKLYSN